MEGNGNHELENVLAKRKINDGIEVKPFLYLVQ